MKLRIIAAVLLLAVLAGAIWEASVLRKEYHSARELHESYADQLWAVEAQAAKLQQELDALTMDEALRQQAEADRLLQDAQELSSQMEQLRIEIEELKTYLEENQAAAEEALAEVTYLQGVYDALEKGLADVQSYIAGN